MSKESYLKGEEKQKALEIIKVGIAVRMRNHEILDQLIKKEIKISERTLRRYKKVIIKTGENSAFEIYQNEIGSKLMEDVLSYKEMERNCWQIIHTSKTSQEKLRAMSVLRGISSDKLNILKHYPRGKYGTMSCNVFDKKKLGKTIHDQKISQNF
jgi:hypothetical protein